METVVLAHGGMGGLMEFFPFLFIGAASFVILTAMRDGSKTGGARTLPTDPLTRQLHAATRKPRAGKAENPPGSPADRPPIRRFGAPRLQVMEGEAESTPPAVPRRFEPPPPRRKTG